MPSPRPAFSEAALSAASFLKEHDHFLLLTHARPDGDTVGSAFALAMALRECGKTAHILPNPLAGQHFMPYFLQAAPGETLSDNLTVVTVDVADAALLPEAAAEYLPRVQCVIDHHTANHVPCGLKCVDSHAAATAEIVREIIALLGLPLSPVTAEGLYLGLMTDTGCFKFSNVRPQTLLYAADAVAAGADAAGLARRYFIKKSAARMRLEAAVIAAFRFFSNDRIVVASLSREQAAILGATEEDIGGLASLTVVPENAEIGIFAREVAAGEVKISVRTDTVVDAASLCAHFGGGGHIRAAGCTLKNTTLAEACTLMLEEAERRLLC